MSNLFVPFFPPVGSWFIIALSQQVLKSLSQRGEARLDNASSSANDGAERQRAKGNYQGHHDCDKQMIGGMMIRSQHLTQFDSRVQLCTLRVSLCVGGANGRLKLRAARRYVCEPRVHIIFLSLEL